ncbi:MAG TPA: sensor histidine kinase [Tepidisphaeraceae bacterium]|nr:sensor histidine kinase [Tepidisphaeraceae bacterium]
MDRFAPFIRAANAAAPKSRLRALPLRWHLSLFGLLIVLPLVLIWVLLAFLYVQAEQQRYHDEAFAIVRDASRSIDQELDRYAVALRVLSQSAVLAQGDFERFYNLAQQLTSILPDTAIALRRPDGQTILNTNFPWGTALPNVSDKLLIAADHKALTDRALAISDMFVGVSQKTYVALVQPVILNGKVEYLLSLAVSTNKLSQILSSQVRSSEWLIGLVDNNDRIIGRNWEPEKYIGQKASEAFIQNTRGESGIFIATSLEGVQVYDVYIRSPLTGWRIGAGILLPLFQAPVRHSFYAMVAMVAAGLFCSLAFAYFYAGKLLRPVAALESLSKLSATDIQRPQESGIKEFDAVTTTLTAAFSELDNRGRQLRDNEARISADLQDMMRLHRLGEQLLQNDAEFKKCLLEIIDTAIVITNADKGNIQLFDRTSGGLVISAQRGFDDAFLKFFAKVSDDAAACAAAMRSGQRVIVEDVLASEIFAGQSSQAALITADVRAVISSPLVSSAGALLGMISTHFSNPNRPDDRQLRLLDLLARQAADYLERKQAEQIQATLSREVQHRSSNLLSIVQSLAHRSLTSYATIEEARTAFEGRLESLARANRQLSNSHWAGVGLRQLVQAELEPFADRTTIEGADLTISSQHAQSFSLALHELATNAVKYGSLSNRAGNVEIHWTVDQRASNDLLKFRWQEKNGPAVVMPAHQGFGTSLLKTAFPDIRLDYSAGGVICEIDVVLGKEETESADVQAATVPGDLAATG